MKFQGSKFTIGRKIADYIQNDTKYSSYLEPFCGSLGVGRHMLFPIMIFNDISTDLILFLRNLPIFEFPKEVTENDYKRLKTEEPSPLRGFVGYFLSFGGKWFGGYAQKYIKTSRKRDFLQEAIRSAKKLDIDIPEHAIFENRSYDELSPIGFCIYCDPPYANTTGYTTPFDHDKFWNKVREWSKHNDVYVSSYEAPTDFELVWESPKRMTLSKKKETRFERIFKMIEQPP
jgi:DNA adenine methylase